MHELKFINYDATPMTITLQVSSESVAPIMAWYGGYYAGDCYKVTLDGKPLVKDLNGELVGNA